MVVPNAVDVAVFRPAAAAEARRRDELLWVGYRSVSKGIADPPATPFAEVRRQRAAHDALRLIGQFPTDAGRGDWHRPRGRPGDHRGGALRTATDRAAIVAAMARASLFVHASRRRRSASWRPRRSPAGCPWWPRTRAA